jgi:hypothetical protein
MADRSVSVKVSADIGNFVGKMAAAGSAAKGFASKLDASSKSTSAADDHFLSMNKRMDWMVQSALALGPALVPIAGAAIPAVAGLSLAFAGVAGGAATALLAFNGVGDGLKAMNDYGTEPTADSLEKMHAAMQELSPAGRDFVGALQGMTPELDRLQSIASEGMLPGVQEGLDSVLQNMPIAEEFVGNFADSLGDLAADAGDRLNDPVWQSFFDYIGTSGVGAMDDLARSSGNVVEGLASMLQAADPMSQDFMGGLVNATEDFAKWSAELGDSEGFASFMDYLRDTGPMVLDTLGALGGAFASFVEAAAPVGQAILPVIEGLADGLAAIAQSPAGPALIGAAAGLSLLGRAMATVSAVKGSKIATGLSAFSGPAGRSLSANLNAAARASGPAVTGMTAFGKAATKVGMPVSRLRSALGGTGARMGGGLVGGMLLMDQAGRKAGSALASFETIAGAALLGFSVGGPIGAAVGGGAALMYEMATSTSDTQIALADLSTNLQQTPTDFETSFKGLGVVNDKLADFQAAEDAAAKSVSAQADAANGATDVNKGYGTSLAVTAEDMEAGGAAAGALEQELTGAQKAVIATADGMSYLSEAMGRGALDTSSPRQLAESAQKLAPAFEAAGISLDDVLAKQARWAQDGMPDGASMTDPMDAAIARVQKYVAGVDTMRGKTQTAAEAFSMLDSAMSTNADQAQALGAALTAMGSDEMGADQAALGLQQSLGTLTGALDSSGRMTLQNKVAIGERVNALKASMTAEANAGASVTKLNGMLERGVDSIMQSAKAKGLDTQATRALLKQYGLTPKLIKTVMRLEAKEAKADAAQLERDYRKLPRNVRTKLEAMGAEATNKQIRNLGKSYNMTPRQIRTMIAAVNAKQAENEARKVAKAYNAIPKAIRVKVAEYGGEATRKQLGRIKVDGQSLSGKQIKVILTAQDNASTKIKGAKADVQGFDGTKGEGKLDVDDGQVPNRVNSAKNTVKGFDSAKGEGSLDVDTSGVTSGISAARSAVAAFGSVSSTATVTVNHVTNYVTNGSPPKSADGNIFGSVQAFAGGGMTEQHRAQIAQPANPYRIWAEPETGGESYIPLAQSKRVRSKQIWRDTGRLLGANFIEYANGGTNGGKDKEPKDLPQSTIHHYMKWLKNAFGKNSPVTQGMHSWMEALKKNNLKQKAFMHQMHQMQDNQRDKAFKQFKIGKGTDYRSGKSEVNELLKSLTQAFGKNSAIVKRMERLSDHLLKDLKQRDRLQKTIEQQTTELKSLRQAQASYTKSVASNFQTDLFGEENTLDQAMLQARADRNDAKTFERAMRKARKLGLSGAAFKELAASGNIGLAQDLDTRKEIKALERLVAQQNKAAMSVGSMAGNEVYAERVRNNTQALHRLEARLRRLDRHIEHGKLAHQIGKGGAVVAHKVVKSHEHKQGRYASAAAMQNGPGGIANNA